MYVWMKFTIEKIKQSQTKVREEQKKGIRVETQTLTSKNMLVSNARKRLCGPGKYDLMIQTILLEHEYFKYVQSWT